MFVTIIVIGLGLFSFGYFYGSRHFVVDEKTIYFDDLPDGFDGYRIAQFSDFHAVSFHMGHESDVEKLVNLINKQNCDAIFFTGDMVTISTDELDGFDSQLSRLKAKDGVFSVLGNHDYNIYQKKASKELREADTERLIEREKRMGWNLLLNEHAIVRRGNDSIAVVGVHNFGWAPRFPKLGDLDKAQCGVDSSTFKVLLSHDPTHWHLKVLPTTNIKMVFSGHTHAGQLKIFGWSPTEYIYDTWSGLFEVDGKYLYVNDGVGCVPVPCRIGAWPEISVITLKKKHHHISK